MGLSSAFRFIFCLIPTENASGVAIHLQHMKYTQAWAYKDQDCDIWDWGFCVVAQTVRVQDTQLRHSVAFESEETYQGDQQPLHTLLFFFLWTSMKTPNPAMF